MVSTSDPAGTVELSARDGALQRYRFGQRTADVWICRNCGKLYHERNDPPKVAGKCDACGGELYQRDDDKADVVRNRLEKQKPPAELIEHYRAAGVLREINGEQSLDEVTALLLEAIK